MRTKSGAASTRRRTRWSIGIVAVATLAVGGTMSQAAPGGDGPPASAGATLRPVEGSVEGLRVLVTNDDGVLPGAQALGLFELRKALCDAGADVIVVGPWSDRSGASASITYGSSSTRFVLTTPQIDAAFEDDCSDAPSGGAVYGACLRDAAGAPCEPDTPSLTPADAVTLGASRAVQVLHGWEGGPDVIVSGINRGGNDGLNVNISGTLGAATIGSSLGYPTIAVSASSSGNWANNAAAAAAWSAGFVGLLAANDLLPEDYVVAVNYPRTDRQAITEARWTTVAQRSFTATGYNHHGGLVFESIFAGCDPQYVLRCGAPEPGSDSAVYSGGVIAVTPVSVNRTAGDVPSMAALRAVVQAGYASPVPPHSNGQAPVVVHPTPQRGPNR